MAGNRSGNRGITQEQYCISFWGICCNLHLASDSGICILASCCPSLLRSESFLAFPAKFPKWNDKVWDTVNNIKSDFKRRYRLVPPLLLVCPFITWKCNYILPVLCVNKPCNWPKLWTSTRCMSRAGAASPATVGRIQGPDSDYVLSSAGLMSSRRIFGNN